MKIIQITDLHLGFENEDTRGIDVRANFIKVWHAALQESPDLIILTGDVCYKGPHKEIYDWLYSQLDEAMCKVFIIPGNHDVPNMIDEQYLPTHKDEIGQYYDVLHYNQREIILLDTAIGKMGDTQWQWLENQIDKVRTRAIAPIIFMHHPPIIGGVPFMDINHSFKEIKRFEAIMLGYSGPHIDIFCGHYHAENTIQRKYFSVHIAPSTFFQIRKDQEAFGVDHYNVGYRQILLMDGQIEHSVIYFEGEKL